MASRARKTLVISLVAIAFSSFALALSLYEYWLHHSPPTPRSETGQTYQLNEHGYFFYVTRTQSWLFHGLLAVFGIFGAAAGILNVQWKALPNPHDDLPKKFY
jgi:H+/Cl- antiporter ClcA